AGGVIPRSLQAQVGDPVRSLLRKPGSEFRLLSLRPVSPKASGQPVSRGFFYSFAIHGFPCPCSASLLEPVSSPSALSKLALPNTALAKARIPRDKWLSKVPSFIPSRRAASCCESPSTRRSQITSRQLSGSASRASDRRRSS